MIMPGIFATSKYTLDSFKSKNPVRRGIVITELFVCLFLLFIASFFGIFKGYFDQNYFLLGLSIFVFIITLLFLVKDLLWRN